MLQPNDSLKMKVFKWLGWLAVVGYAVAGEIAKVYHALPHHP